MASDARKLRDSDEFSLWRLVMPRDDESCRWEAIDGRWISLSLGRGADAGKVLVASSDGRRERVDSFEGALELARLWRA